MLDTIVFEELSSTNDYALEYLRKNSNIKDTLIIAKTQSAGRGRLNERVWVSCLGNFHGSYILNLDRLKIDSKKSTMINYMALSALKDIIDELAKKSKEAKDIRVKSPNDILINNKKVAGILIEIFHPYVIIGIGVNLKVSPIKSSTDLLKELNCSIGLSEFGMQLYENLILRLKNAGI